MRTSSPRTKALPHAIDRIADRLRSRGPRRRARERSESAGAPVDRFWEQLERELERARRHERQFALTRLTFERDVDAQTAVSRFDLRTCDAIAIVDGAPTILWSESDTTAARRGLRRLAASLSDGCRFEASTVTFPQDGLSLAALFEGLSTPAETSDEILSDADIRSEPLPPTPAEGIVHVNGRRPTGVASRADTDPSPHG